jgi:LysM domain
MTRQVAAVWVLLLLLGAGCATPPQPPVVEPPRGYSSADLHVSFDVPTGWTTEDSWKPIHPAPHAVRFASPSRESTLTLAYGPVGELNCSAAARAALLSVSGAVLRAVRAFELPAAAGKMPAGSGETSGPDSQGMARYFCTNGTAVVVEAAATKPSFAAHFGELQQLLDSVNYEDQGHRLAIEAPAGTPPGRTYFVHVVRFRGETLARIARWYTGSYNTWREIALANENISSPNRRLKVHTEVKIPLELVVREAAFPAPPRAAPPAKPSTEAPAKEEATAPQEGAGGESAPLPPVIGPR